MANSHQSLDLLLCVTLEAERNQGREGRRSKRRDPGISTWRDADDDVGPTVQAQDSEGGHSLRKSRA